MSPLCRGSLSYLHPDTAKTRAITIGVSRQGGAYACNQKHERSSGMFVCGEGAVVHNRVTEQRRIRTQQTHNVKSTLIRHCFNSLCLLGRYYNFGDICIQNIHSTMKILNMAIPILMFYYHFSFKKTLKMHFVAPTSNGYQLNKNARQLHILTCQPMKATLRNDVEFAIVSHRIYCRKFMTLSNQTSCALYTFSYIVYEVFYFLYRT